MRNSLVRISHMVEWIICLAKMNKIKIFLQRPWKVSDSAYYKYLNEDLPHNIEYVNLKNQRIGTITSSKKFWRNHFLKQKIKNFFRKTKIPYPNAHFTKNSKDYDLIHCAHCLSWNKKTPWICDIEYADQFYVGNKSKILKKIVRIILKRKSCKKIMAWSEWSKKNILDEFPEFDNKVEVVYPAIPLAKICNKDYKKINLLFVGRDFVGKGGEIALEIMDNLTKKHPNVYGIIVSDIPKEFKDKFSKNKKINLLDLMPQEKLFGEVYCRSDIFIYPTRSDTLGFAILEAQSFGMPVIATKTVSTHTINETISNGKTGFIIEGDVSAWYKNKKERKRIIKEMINKIEGLIKDKKVLKKMSDECIKTIKEGKFSIKERNKKLERIFRESIQNEK